MTSAPARQFLPLGTRLDPAARIPAPRAGSAHPIPAWPDTLIAPTDTERVRWFQLWSSPEASAWVGPAHEHKVATLVRLEVRCRQPLPTDEYLAKLDHLRCELGLVQSA